MLKTVVALCAYFLNFSWFFAENSKENLLKFFINQHLLEIKIFCNIKFFIFDQLNVFLANKKKV